MPCIQKKTLETIIATNNNYVVPVKKNRRKLYDIVSENLADIKDSISHDKTEERNRGRNEIRESYVFLPTVALNKYMPHVNSVIRVYRCREEKGQISQETVFYISNLKLNAGQFNTGIRNHWGIENRLHWVKDCVLGEDRTTTKNKAVAPIQSLFKSIITSLAYIFSNSVIGFQRALAHNIKAMIKIFYQ